MPNEVNVNLKTVQVVEIVMRVPVEAATELAFFVRDGYRVGLRALSALDLQDKLYEALDLAGSACDDNECACFGGYDRDDRNCAGCSVQAQCATQSVRNACELRKKNKGEEEE
jgi:hypothetical protein